MLSKAWGATDVGNVKKQNEDNYFIDPDQRVFVVADGVSGRDAGEVASKELVDYFEAHAKELAELVKQGNALEDDRHRERVLHRLTEIVQEANTKVYELGKQPEYNGGMATTVVALVLSDEAGFVAHVGDSRIYLKRNDKIFRITEDHTYAEELRKQGGDQLPESVNERFSHVLTRSIGGRPRVDVDVVFFELQPKDSFLLCTDGLTDYLSGSEILDYIKRHDGEEVVQSLVGEAKQRGGRDNITAVHVHVGEESEDLRDTIRSTARIDTMRKINFLSQMLLFKDLTHVELLRMLRIVYEQSYSRGDVIVAQGDRSAALYLLVEGSVAVSRDKKHLASLSTGEHFGELSLFEESTSSVTVYASSPEVLLLAISIQQFRDLINEDPKLGNKLLWNLLRQLARNMVNMNERMVEEGMAKTLELHAISRDEARMPRLFDEDDD